MLTASWHCAAVRLEIERRPRQLTACNCSICRRYGARRAYYTCRSVRVVEDPPGASSAYTWGDGRLEFHHCRRCGCVLFPRTKKAGDATRIVVNARMVDPQDTASIRIRLLDGASSWTYLE